MSVFQWFLRDPLVSLPRQADVCIECVLGRYGVTDLLELDGERERYWGLRMAGSVQGVCLVHRCETGNQCDVVYTCIVVKLLKKRKSFTVFIMAQYHISFNKYGNSEYQVSFMYRYIKVEL